MERLNGGIFTAESGVPEMQIAVPLDVGASHPIDWHEVPGDYEPRCVWTDAPLMGARIQVQPAGGDPITLVEGATDGMFTHYTGTTSYATTYVVTVDDHGTIYTDSWGSHPLFTVTASASVDTLVINWSPCDSPTTTPCVGGNDNPNDLPVDVSVFDASGVLLFQTTILDRGAKGITTTALDVPSASRVSVTREAIRMFTTVAR